mgnify:CR=1 FL=1
MKGFSLEGTSTGAIDESSTKSQSKRHSMSSIDLQKSGLGANFSLNILTFLSGENV